MTLRRVAHDFSVTPMALYRHVRDKQDLINAMTEAVLDDMDVAAGLRPSMPWADQVRRVMSNFKEQMAARPLALQLSIAYTGERGPTGFWRMSETILGILFGAGFTRRESVVLMRVVSNLLSGYLLLLSYDDPSMFDKLPRREMNLLRKRFELAQLSLPEEQFPTLVASAHEMAEVWLSNPDRWWRQTVDILVLGIEAMLDRRADSNVVGAIRGSPPS